jgi:flagellar biosynthesis regulator FlbT
MYNEIQRLKELNRKAKIQKERDTIDAQMQFLSMENPEAFAESFKKSMQNSIEELKTNSIKGQLSEISKMVSLSYISKNYFNKSFFVNSIYLTQVRFEAANRKSLL